MPPDTPDPTGVPLTDFFGKMLGVEHRMTKLETQQASTAEALRLQRTETDRRLSELNNEAGRILDFQAKVPSQDSFGALDERVKLLEGSQSAYAGRRETQTEVRGESQFNISVIIAIIVGAATIAAAIIFRH